LNGRKGPFELIVNFTTIIIVISRIDASNISVGELNFMKNILIWGSYSEGIWIFIIIIYIIMFKVINVNIIINIIDIILIVWFGIRDTKYENITIIPPI
jgi:hypothetical protein